MTEDRLFRPDQAAKYLSISRPSLYRYVREGKIEKPIKIGKRASGFRHSALEKFIQNQAKQAS